MFFVSVQDKLQAARFVCLFVFSEKGKITCLTAGICRQYSETRNGFANVVNVAVFSFCFFLTYEFATL